MYDIHTIHFTYHWCDQKIGLPLKIRFHIKVSNLAPIACLSSALIKGYALTVDCICKLIIYLLYCFTGDTVYAGSCM